MAKHPLKILRWEHRKIFKVCLAILQHYAILQMVFLLFQVYLTLDCNFLTSTSLPCSHPTNNKCLLSRDPMTTFVYRHLQLFMAV